MSNQFQNLLENTFGPSLQSISGVVVQVLVLVITSALAIKSMIWVVKFGVQCFKNITAGDVGASDYKGY